MKRSGFTLIELIFVIVIIGILAGVAIPKFKDLRQNALVSNLVSVISDFNGSGGASAYLNAVELNGIDKDDLNITNIYKFQGGDWAIDTTDNKTAYYRQGKTDLNATFKYIGNGEVNVTIGSDDATIQNILTNKGYSYNTTFTINLDAQE